MTTDISEIDKEIGEIPEKGKQPRRRASALTFLAFIFALIALAGTALMWWQEKLAGEQKDERASAGISRLESAGSELSFKLSQVEGKLELLADNDSSAQFTALNKRFDADATELAALDQAIRGQLALSRSLQAAAESMQGRLLAAETVLVDVSSQELDSGAELDLGEVD